MTIHLSQVIEWAPGTLSSSLRCSAIGSRVLVTASGTGQYAIFDAANEALVGAWTFTPPSGHVVGGTVNIDVFGDLWVVPCGGFVAFVDVNGGVTYRAVTASSTGASAVAVAGANAVFIGPGGQVQRVSLESSANVSVGTSANQAPSGAAIVDSARSLVLWQGVGARFYSVGVTSGGVTEMAVAVSSAFGSPQAPRIGDLTYWRRTAGTFRIYNHSTGTISTVPPPVSSPPSSITAWDGYMYWSTGADVVVWHPGLGVTYAEPVSPILDAAGCGVVAAGSLWFPTVA